MPTHYILVADIGGTKYITGLVPENKTAILGKRKGDIAPDLDCSSLVEKLIESMNNSIKEAKIGMMDVLGAGVSSAGLWQHRKGTVLNPNLPFAEKRLDIGKRVKEEFSLSTYVENDVNAGVQAEAIYGWGRKSSCRLIGYLTISSGIGLGLWDQKRKELISGENNVAPEVGHDVIVPNGLECDCGQRGHWQAYGSGNGVVRVAEAVFNSDPFLLELAEYLSLDLGNLDRGVWVERFGKSGSYTAKEIYQAARKGDRFSLAITKLVAYINAIGFGHIINHHQPGALLVGGSPVLKDTQYVLHPVISFLHDPRYKNEFTFIPEKLIPVIRKTELGEDVVAYGAASVVLNGNESNRVR